MRPAWVVEIELTVGRSIFLFARCTQNQYFKFCNTYFSKMLPFWQVFKITNIAWEITPYFGHLKKLLMKRRKKSIKIDEKTRRENWEKVIF